MNLVVEWAWAVPWVLAVGYGVVAVVWVFEARHQKHRAEKAERERDRLIRLIHGATVWPEHENCRCAAPVESPKVPWYEGMW